MKIPLIVLNFNQLTYLKNLINWWQFYYPSHPVYIIDNASTYQPLLDFYDNEKNISVVRYPNNTCTDNVVDFLSKHNFDYYVLSDADISPCPNIPPDFLYIFKHCIDHYGYSHVGFTLRIDDLPDYIDNKSEIVFNEQSFWNTPVEIEYNGKKYTGYKAPIDTTFALYKGGVHGWEKPMPPHKWDNALRIFEAHHLMWYLNPSAINGEMYNYFNTALYRIPGVSSTGVNNYRPKKAKVKAVYYNDIITPELLTGVIENNEFHGFREDYHVLHCLLRKYSPKTICEIGTNMGVGTNIICNACPDAKVYSVDLPTELAHISLQSPVSEGKGDKVGSKCRLPFIQVRADSTKFDYSTIYPVEAWFIDGEHTEVNVYHESLEAIKSQAALIIWHDSDIQGVYKGILKAFDGNVDYQLNRVADTRIAYAIRNSDSNI